MEPIPTAFVRLIIGMHGAKGQAWLNRLPGILADCAAQWDVVIEPPFGNLSYHYVTPAHTSAGEAVVLKVCAPTGEFAQECAALRHFGGQGMARLLAADGDREALLLERLLPSNSLRTMVNDAQATHSVIEVMRQLWRPVTDDFPYPTVADWHAGFTHLREHYDGTTGPFPEALVREAEALYDELSATAAPVVLLHGDLHHDNVLAARRAPWLGIDPKGLLGEPAYEVGAWLRNFLPDLLRQPDPRQILARRIDQFAEELGFDRARVRGWGVYQVVLSAWADVEDFGKLTPTSLVCAELLTAIP